MDATNTTLYLILLRKKPWGRIPASISYGLDLVEAFPSVPHSLVWLTVETFGLHGRTISLLQALYRDTNSIYNLSGIETGYIPQGDRGIKQGCPLSMSLFCLALEFAIRDTSAKYPLIINNQQDNLYFSISYMQQISRFMAWCLMQFLVFLKVSNN